MEVGGYYLFLDLHYLFKDNARVGDAYMNQIQSFAAYVPYMTVVGNHEMA